MLIKALLMLSAFAAGSCALAGAVRGWRVLRRHHAELDRELGGRRGSWSLAIDIVARELPRGPLARLRRRITTDLVRSAAPAELTAERFLARAFLEGAGLAIVMMILMLALAGRPWFFLALGAGLFHALLLRPQLLHGEAAQRVAAIQRRLPYAIDQMVLILEAGGTLREALAMLGDSAESDPLGEEIAIALTQMRAGTSQAQALSDLAERLQLDDLGALVRAINRGERTGAPMARTLETQAELFRFRRLQRAERLAVEAPVKMMFPNMIIMLAVLVLVLGPVLVKLLNQGLF